MNNPKPEVIFHQRPNAFDVTKIRTRPSTKIANHSENGETKKMLVRHPEMSVPVTLLKTDTVSEKSDPRCKSVSYQDTFKTDLSAPNLNSALRLVKEISLAKKTPPRSQSIKLVDEGKVLQKVNFPYEEHLYHDLVALNVSQVMVSGPGSSARSSKRHIPLRERDKEPQLSQFFIPSFTLECCTSRELPLQFFEPRSCDSASIYQRMCSWSVQE